MDGTASAERLATDDLPSGAQLSSRSGESLRRLHLLAFAARHLLNQRMHEPTVRR